MTYTLMLRMQQCQNKSEQVPLYLFLLYKTYRTYNKVKENMKCYTNLQKWTFISVEIYFSLEGGHNQILFT